MLHLGDAVLDIRFKIGIRDITTLYIRDIYTIHAITLVVARSSKVDEITRVFRQGFILGKRFFPTNT